MNKIINDYRIINIIYNEKIKNECDKIILNILKYTYEYLSNIILQIQNHIIILYNNNIIDILIKNNIFNELLIITDKLNNSYNKYILNYLSNNIKNKLYNIIYNLLLYTKPLNFYILNFKNEYIPIQNESKYNLLNNNNNNNNNNNLLELINPSIKNKLNNNNLFPLYEEELLLLNIIINYGYNNLINLINIFIYKIYILSEEQKLLINEISKIFIPIKICYKKLISDKIYFFKKPNKYNNFDLLKTSCELLIKLNNNEYLKITGFFINDDRISFFIKTSQINNIIYYNLKKTIIDTLILENKYNIKYIKKFIKFDYIGNIYTYSLKSYIKYFNKLYLKYQKIITLNFTDILNELINNKNIISNIINIYEIIFLLSLGDSNNIKNAVLILDFIKHNNKDIILLYNILIKNLPSFFLLKIKQVNKNIKNQLIKLESIFINYNEYKKQLLINYNIPDKVKILTLEKINEIKKNNNDYYKQLTYIKYILNFPWSSENDIFLQNKNIAKKYLLNIENKLNNYSYGHNDVKKIILQIIGKWIINPDSDGNSIGLVGPPGVGKTLLAKSIANALNIPFSEITLGGQNDGELLFGHGYTYSGSQPGLIIKKMIDMKNQRCIIYFDELDKTSLKNGSINEITSILIHLTDPNMNNKFQDRFFQGIDFPLNKVIFIFSYNDPSLIDPVLLDRLIQIKINPYTNIDKINIIKKYIIPEIENTLKIKNSINFDDNLIEYIIENYTNEAGVRDIKRKIDQIYLLLNLKLILSNKNKNKIKYILNKDNIINILGKPNNDIIKIYNIPQIGIINALYATNNGDGGIIPIQIFNNYTNNNNEFKIHITGKQGIIMKESLYCSLTCALNYIKRSPIYNIKNIEEYMNLNFKYGFHVHTPSLSISKDGPSAGSAFTCAFISIILNKYIKNDIGITGEIELTGKIIKIGGLIYKLIGAKKAGIKLVYIPKENENDINDIYIKYPNLINKNFNIKYYNYIDEILNEILI
jgi:endopeptidase La